MRFRDLFSICLIGLFTFYLGTSKLQELTSSSIENGEQVNREDITRRVAILLKRDAWVEFLVPADSTNIRLMTNAALSNPDTPRITYSDPRIGHRYSLQYELLDENRELITASEYHFRSRVKQFFDKQSGKFNCPIFFSKDELISTQTRVMQLAINRTEKRVAIIRVKALDMDPELHEIVARVNSRVERQNYEERQTWNRMTQKRREGVCHFCVYNHSLLSESERANLLRWQWTNTPTIGECESRALYFVGDVDDERMDWQAIPVGKLAMRNSVANFPVPETLGTLRFEFTPIESKPCMTAEVQWVGPTPQQQVSLSHEVGEEDLKLEVGGGMVQVTPDTDVVIRAYWKSASSIEEEFEITPEPMLVPTYLADERSVDFSISHFRDQSTPIKVAVRRVFDDVFFETSTLPSNGESLLSEGDAFRWEMLDGENEVVRAGELVLSEMKSTYDHLWVDGQALPVSDPATFYFQAPPGIKKIRLSSMARPLLFYAAVRPAELQRVTRVPEDYFSFNPGGAINRTWFSIRPFDQQEIVRTNRAFFVRTQTQVKEIDPQIVAGNYTWKRFEPEGNWIGRRMLVPIDKEQLIREQAAASTYMELPHGKTVQVRKTDVERSNQQRLVFVSEQSPGELEILLNGQVVFSRKILSSRGQIDIPQFPSDHANILIRSDNPTRLFANGLEIVDGKRFFKRTAQRFDAGELNFPYQKQAPVELLGLRFFRDGNLQERCQIKVTIEPEFPLETKNRPTTSWTVLNRIYDLKPTESENSVLLDAEGQVDQGHRCFVKLNEDLPNGNYNIRVESVQGRNGYVLLYQTLPDVIEAPAARPTQTKLISHGKFEAAPGILPEPTEDRWLDEETGKARIVEAGSSSPKSESIDKNLQDFNLSVDLNDRLLERLKATQNPASIEAPSAEQLERTQQLFAATLNVDMPDQELVAAWHELGWQLDWLKDERVAIISERRDERRGRGVYAIRLGSDSQVAFQAPHRFFDEKTGTITRKLFAEHDVLAACWNTAHRKEVDVAHQDRHYFNAFMQAVAETHQNVSFAQLHGFAAKNKKGAARKAQVIISDSTEYPARHARLAALALKQQFGAKEIKLYPIEVESLGGTQNSQASLLRNGSQNDFLHVEMNAEFRQALVDSASKRLQFFEAIGESTSNY